MKNKTSVVIATRNRSADLSECLSSLLFQETLPDELVIINNDSTDNTVAIGTSFSQRAPFPLRMISEKRKGYPILYNRGLQESKYAWVAFLDDDCVADPGWFRGIKEAITQYPTAACIMGISQTVHIQNSYSFVTYILNCVWKENGSSSELVTNGEILDNKNIVYNKIFLSKHALQFNEKRISYRNGSSEDCDLGERIVQSGGKCFYVKTIVVKHKDPTH